MGALPLQAAGAKGLTLKRHSGLLVTKVECEGCVTGVLLFSLNVSSSA